MAGSNDWLMYVAMLGIAILVGLAAIVAISEWVRDRRDRAIYKKTRRDGAANLRLSAQVQRRSAASERN